MIDTNVKTTEKKSWISSVKFTKDEKALIIKARNKLHIDMPSLYHDCIMASVIQIVGKTENGYPAFVAQTGDSCGA